MIPDDEDFDEFLDLRVWTPTQIAMRTLDAARGESLEAAISAACELVFYHWFHHGSLDQVLADWGTTDDNTDPLRLATRRGARRMAEVIHETLLASGREGHHRVFEELLSLRTKRLGRAGLSHSSSSAVSSLLASIVGNGRRLLDPACGYGGSLIAAARESDRELIAGVDVNPEATAFAMRRLILAGLEPDLNTFDWVGQKPAPGWDAIVVEPPMGTKIPLAQLDWRPDRFGTGTIDGDSLWLSSVSSSLSEGGRGVILLPAGVASRAGQSARLRNELLSKGLIEAIIALPQGAVLNTDVATCIWVLAGSPDPRKNRNVLLVNGRAAAADPDDAPLGDVSQITETCTGWLDKALAPQSESWFARLVDVDTLMEDGDASPQRHLGTPPASVLPRPAPPGRLMTELRLSGFKSIDEAPSIPLRPLTLIYGKNSAGKSSLIQALLLLKQSVAGEVLATSGTHTNLGSFSGVTHNHDLTRDVSIGISFASSVELDSPSALPDPELLRSSDFVFTSKSERRDGQLFRVRSGFGEHMYTWERTAAGTYVVPIIAIADMVRVAYETDSVYPPRKKSSGKQGARVKSELTRVGIDHAEFKSAGLVPSSVSLEMLADVEQRTSSIARSGLVEAALRTTAALFGSVGDELKNLLDRVVYLGPLRQPPERINFRASNNDSLDIPFFLLDNTSEREDVSTRLQSLGVQYELDAVTVSDPEDRNLFGDMAALVLTDTRTKIRLSPADVGFGISQVLPIVTELSARTRSVILIEQPEIHLHPAMQADLADLLIESIDEAGRANQVIAETHSENIMLRVQKRIREGVLNTGDVAVLYVDQDEKGAALVRELRLDKDGDFIDTWPHGFFAERLDDLFGSLG